MKKANGKTHNLDVIKDHALELMSKAGYPVTLDVSVVLDEKLPFMGYTTDKSGKPVIVVSGLAVSSGGALNLVIHELSHVYRSQSGHPSHDYQLLTAITGWVMQGRIVHAYQEKILHTIINHLQDLYADDISFAIFKEKKQENLNEFFMGWIHKPHAVTSTSEKAWENGDSLLSTAFAQANLERHNVTDTGEKLEKAVKMFLAKSDKRIVAKYPFFKEFMVNLPEKVTEKEFEKLLIQYLGEFLKLTRIT